MTHNNDLQLDEQATLCFVVSNCSRITGTRQGENRKDWRSCMILGETSWPAGPMTAFTARFAGRCLIDATPRTHNVGPKVVPADVLDGTCRLGTLRRWLCKRDSRVPKTVGSSDPHTGAVSGSRSSAGPSQVPHMYSLHILPN